MRVAFIIGSGRSGTTISGDILNCHKEIAVWHEPYYLWGKYFNSHENDVWNEKDLNKRSIQNIQKAFGHFSKKSKKEVVLDKSPVNSFNIKLIHTIFPHAKWIHIIRDGRDVTLSYKKEWIKRGNIVRQKDFFNLSRVALKSIGRQPFFMNKLMMVSYEIKRNLSLDPGKFLNKSKWGGKPYYGPRFKDWQRFLHSHTTLQFNAMQWMKSVAAVREDWGIIPDENKIEIRYEDLIGCTDETIDKMLRVLEVSTDPHCFDSIPKIKKDNVDKWRNEFNPQEIEQIKPILSPLLKELGYTENLKW